jgi:hypothetical protein
MEDRTRFSDFSTTPLGTGGDRTAANAALMMHQAVMPITVFGRRIDSVSDLCIVRSAVDPISLQTSCIRRRSHRHEPAGAARVRAPDRCERPYRRGRPTSRRRAQGVRTPDKRARLHPFLTLTCDHLVLVHAILGIRPPAGEMWGEARIPRIAWTSETGS